MKDPKQQLSYSEFLEFIADKEETYEYVDGYPVAMGRASTIHQRIVAELVFMLKDTCARNRATPMRTCASGSATATVSPMSP
jgi:Uma2 family endonuclease